MDVTKLVTAYFVVHPDPVPLEYSIERPTWAISRLDAVMAGWLVRLKIAYLLKCRILGVASWQQPLTHAVLDDLPASKTLTHLCSVLTSTGCQAHYNTARPHRSIAQRVPTTKATPPTPPGPTSIQNGFAERSVLNGLINEYT